MITWRRRIGRGCGRLQATASTVVAVLLLGVAGCGDENPAGPDGPDVVPDGQLTFLRPDQAAPPLLTSDTTFVATRGQNLKVELSYAPPPGESQGEDFLELVLHDVSLLQYPSGHPKAGEQFADGDTITIRISVDPELLIASLEPTGLVFDPDKPAELELRYLNADPDYDEDGTADPELEDDIDLWRQENPGDPWERVGDLKDRELDRVRAFLFSFSRYGLGI